MTGHRRVNRQKSWCRRPQGCGEPPGRARSRAARRDLLEQALAYRMALPVHVHFQRCAAHVAASAPEVDLETAGELGVVAEAGVERAITALAQRDGGGPAFDARCKGDGVLAVPIDHP